MANQKCTTSCGLGCDVVTRTLCRVGVNRSMLVTLALLPFAWRGVRWVGSAINDLWSAISGAVGQ